MNSPEKRIYSINVVSWLLSKGIQYIKVEYDKGEGKFYFVFPESKEVGKQITSYRNNTELINFLATYRKLKKMMQDLTVSYYTK